ncbi:protein hym1 [Zygosaccharomyces mellis]|uniref:Protein hym1 n=1 Tax=Zygosaccharomyces mellis TaxID=42258 RepID=A0A4C2E4M7_9SACH|nr:protein hym1 [Zygosaccharomyces mellis]
MFKKYKNQDLDMTFWWKKNPKSPQDYVKFISDQLIKIESSSTQDSKRKAQEEVSKYLMYTKHFILGDTDPRPTAESIDELYCAIYRSELFYDLLIHFGDLEFEARKEVTLIFSICLRYSKDNKLVTVDYLVSKPKTLRMMLKIVESAMQRKAANDLFLTVGNMLMECIKYEQLCRIVLQDPQLWKLFDIVRFGNFETSTESLQILSSALTTHTKLVSKEFFNHENNMNKFIQNINKLMAHGSYVTKRQSTKLLASLIVVRSNNQLMNTYINSLDNLKLIMVLMTDKSKNLQHEAFNVFKVMVANPRKSKPVFDILVKNREKLLKYFETFGLDYQEPTFIDEKEFIVQEIESLPRIVSSNNVDCSANVTASPSRDVAAAQDMA